MDLKNASRAGVQMTLLCIFSIFFGYPSMCRYWDMKTYVLYDKRPSEGIPVPSMTFCPKNTETETGWKRGGELDSLRKRCEGRDTTDCIDTDTFQLGDFLVESVRGVEESVVKLGNNHWSPQLGWTKNGLCYRFEYNSKIGIQYKEHELLFYLNKSLDYKIDLHDPHYTEQVANPLSIPDIGVELETSQTAGDYYMITLTERTELNVPNDPCIENPSYNFQVTAPCHTSGLCQGEPLQPGGLQDQVGQVEPRRPASLYHHPAI